MLEKTDKKHDKTVNIVTYRRAALAICDYELHIEEGRMTRHNRDLHEIGEKKQWN